MVISFPEQGQVPAFRIVTFFITLKRRNNIGLLEGNITNPFWVLGVNMANSINKGSIG